MKKKLKKAIKQFFDPTVKTEHQSLNDQINELHDRIDEMESQHLKMIVRIAQLEGQLDNHVHGEG